MSSCPPRTEDIEALAKDMGMTAEELNNVVVSLHEFNPMMGHRGCRLAVTYPEIAADADQRCHQGCSESLR